jgi:hypothetical protein
LEATNKRLLALTLSTALVAGCTSTAKTDYLAGALAGAAIGGVGGTLNSSNMGESAAIGAVAGAAAGLLVVFFTRGDYAEWMSSARASQPMGQPEAVAAVSDVPAADDREIAIDEAVALGDSVVAGGELHLRTAYRVAGDGRPTVPVRERWTLVRDGREVAWLATESSERKAGGFIAEPIVRLPADLEPGVYAVEHQVETDRGYDLRTTNIVVGG